MGHQLKNQIKMFLVIAARLLLLFSQCWQLLGAQQQASFDAWQRQEKFFQLYINTFQYIMQDYFNNRYKISRFGGEDMNSGTQSAMRTTCVCSSSFYISPKVISRFMLHAKSYVL